MESNLIAAFLPIFATFDVDECSQAKGLMEKLIDEKKILTTLDQNLTVMAELILPGETLSQALTRAYDNGPDWRLAEVAAETVHSLNIPGRRFAETVCYDTWTAANIVQLLQGVRTAATPEAIAARHRWTRRRTLYLQILAILEPNESVQDALDRLLNNDDGQGHVRRRLSDAADCLIHQLEEPPAFRDLEKEAKGLMEKLIDEMKILTTLDQNLTAMAELILSGETLSQALTRAYDNGPDWRLAEVAAETVHSLNIPRRRFAETVCYDTWTAANIVQLLQGVQTAATPEAIAARHRWTRRRTLYLQILEPNESVQDALDRLLNDDDGQGHVRRRLSDATDCLIHQLEEPPAFRDLEKEVLEIELLQIEAAIPAPSLGRLMTLEAWRTLLSEMLGFMLSDETVAEAIDRHQNRDEIGSKAKTVCTLLNLDMRPFLRRVNFATWDKANLEMELKWVFMEIAVLGAIDDAIH
ncbi:plastid transcriptionally active7 [Striga asiatica]|uniref:Plastid transcriptionally active7 n=1 Tax=Striga asiatica TaxID=4170 RepID=A0A5A7P479_STRAF|nr:plastid transcriptionally active7 [Striga asiatica]